MLVRHIYYRTFVLAGAVVLLFMAASADVARTLNAAYFPERPNAISNFGVLLYAALGMLLLVEVAFLLALNLFHKWRRHKADEA